MVDKVKDYNHVRVLLNDGTEEWLFGVDTVECDKNTVQIYSRVNKGTSPHFSFMAVDVMWISNYSNITKQ